MYKHTNALSQASIATLCLENNWIQTNYSSGTYKFLWTREVEQLHHSKVIACDDVKARVGHAGTGDVGFVCVAGPDSYDLVPKDT